MDSVRGQLLIAGPALTDPNFWRTVVLIVEHSDEGAFGLVLNRPSETIVGEAVPEIEELVDPDEPLYIGGPVQPSGVVVLGQFEDPGDGALVAFDDVGVLGAGAALEEHVGGAAHGTGIRRARRLGRRAARRRDRPRRLDPRARRRRGRVLRRAARAVVTRPDAEGRQLRAGRADARRSLAQLMAQGHVHDTRDADRRSLTIALGLILGFMVFEVAAGIVASSLALISDSAHMLTDAFALALSLLAARLAVRPARGSMTYGLGRAEILSAQANGVTLLVLALVLGYESISRLVHPESVKGTIVLVVAIVGVVVNLAATRVLAGGSDHERSLNVEGSFRHILTDLYGFIATAIAAIIILATGFNRADPIASLVVVALMLHASWKLLIASGRVFLEMAPAGLDPEQIGRELAGYPGVVEVARPARLGGNLGLPGAVGARRRARRRGLPRAPPGAPAGAAGALRRPPHDAPGRPRGGAAAAAADRGAERGLPYLSAG